MNTFISKRVFDPLEEAKDEKLTNMWSDMEKAIFLDRFLQFPKDFRRIASFLKNKTTRDCIAFYYDSKQAVPYKGALKEHIMRRKRKGDYQVWDASIQAAVSVGAQVTAGTDEEKPVVFTVPKHDMTFRTRKFHPLRREIFDDMIIDEAAAAEYNEGGDSENSKDSKSKSKKRGRDPLFALDKKQIKFLRKTSQESMSIQSIKARAAKRSNDDDEMDTDAHSSNSSRKAPQKWTAAERNTFLATLEEHGRNWEVLSKAVGTKTISQIKNFYYDYKKQSGKAGLKSDKKGGAKAKSKDSKSQDDDSESTDRTPPNGRSLTPPPGSAQSQAVDMRAIQEQIQQELLLMHRQQELSEAIAREAESQAGHSRNGSSPIPPELSGNELIHHLLKQQQQQHTQNQQLELLRQHEQQLHHQRQQHPQSALHQILSRHHQREPSHASLGHHSQQPLSSMFQSWPPSSASQLLEAHGRLHPAQLAALQQEVENGSKGESPSDMASLQRFLQLRQLQKHQQQQQHHTLSSLMGLAGSAPGSGIPPSVLAQLESLSGGNLPTQADQKASEISALLKAQSMLGYANGGRYPAPADGTHSPHNLSQHAGVSDAMALIHAMQQQRENGGSQHGFGAPDRQA